MNQQTSSNEKFCPCIWVDADACPSSIKDVLYKTAKRVEIEVAVVANQTMNVPNSEWIHLITVPHGADVADDKIVEMMQAGDLIITADIPLAARVVEKGGIALGHRGEVFDKNSVQSRLATRDLMEQFRAAGMETGGPKPMSARDTQTFANALDRTLTQMFQPKR